MDDSELKMIIKHELIHHKRGDLWMKALVLTANAIHWFNPVSYVLIRSINWLCEMSCDEAVVKNMDFAARKRYGELILCTLDRIVARPSGIYSAICESKVKIKGRLDNMMKYERAKVIYVIISIFAALVIFATGCAISSTGLITVVADDKSPFIYESGQDDTNAGMLWPVPGSGRIVALFGMRTHPISKTESIHTGIDIEAKAGDTIQLSKSERSGFGDFGRF